MSYVFQFLSMMLTALFLVSVCTGCNSEASQMKKMTRWIDGTKWHAVSATDANGGVIDEGALVALRLPGHVPILCLDGLHIPRQSYLDIGNPVGPAVSVVIKTLAFENH